LRTGHKAILEAIFGRSLREGGKIVCIERTKIQVLTDETLKMRAKVRRLVKAPVKQEVTLETEVKSEVLDGVHRFHWVERV
jgi:hypothetical protein